MRKIYYTSDGWVCQRYPYDLAIDDENRFIEADDEQYAQTLVTDSGKAWRVVDGKLVIDVYDQDLCDKECFEGEIAVLKQSLAETDYQAIKFAEGLITESEYAEIKAKRQAWRDEINELEKKIN